MFTSLTKEALPIIRYRTKDLTRLLPGTARPAHRRMGRITGRSDDMIILRGVNLFPSQIEEIALRIPELSPHFQLELTRPEGQRMDQLTVKIERRETVTVEGARRRPRSPAASRSRSTWVLPARWTSWSPDRWSGPTASCAGSTTCAPRPDRSVQPPVPARPPAADRSDREKLATMPTTATTTKRGRPGYDQQSVLLIAVDVFNRHGYDATSMGILAENLGISKSAIYHHVPSKGDLLKLALDHALGGLEAILDQPRGHSPAPPRPGWSSSCARPSPCWWSGCRSSPCCCACAATRRSNATRWNAGAPSTTRWRP